MQLLQGKQVGTDVLAYGGVRTAARLDGFNPVAREGFVPGEELSIFSIILRE
jgi:hypothetical protein